MTSVWRLILDGPVDGALNMALDRAAQLAREDGMVPPTLRLYRWSRPTVSLGRFQAGDAVDSAACADFGVDICRRVTGGRGVLHDDEVTYSVVASLEDGMSRGVAASYRQLSGVLARAYRELGIDAELTRHDRTRSDTAACYLATTRADLSLGAAKLSGSAQGWKGSTVLQHGSFVRSRDVAREARVFRLGDDDAERLATDALTMETVLGTVPSIRDVENAIAEAFAFELGIELSSGEWTSAEAELAAGLLESSRL